MKQNKTVSNKKTYILISILTILIAFMDISGLPAGLFVNVHVLDIAPFYFSLSVNFLLIFLIISLYLHFLCPKWTLGLRREGFVKGMKMSAPSVIILTLACLVAFIIGLTPFDNRPSLPRILMEGFIYYIGVAAVEELYIRGLLLNLIEKMYGQHKHATSYAIVLSSVIFGFGHIFGVLGSPLLTILCKVTWTIALGLYLGILYKKSKNLWVPICAHAIFDFCSVPYCFSTKTDYVEVTLWILLATFLLLALCCIPVLLGIDKQTSFSYQFIEWIIRKAGIKNYYNLEGEELLQTIDKKFSNQSYEPPKDMKKTLNVECTEVLGQPCYRISNRNKSEASKNRVVLFIHGGGYLMEINNLHWSAIKRIASETSADVVVPIYPLAPKYGYKETFAMLTNVYVSLLEQYDSNHIIIEGDSAGAQIALSFCQYIKEYHSDAATSTSAKMLPQPDKLILLSPPVDFAPDEKTMARYQELNQVDPMISPGIIPFVKEYWAKDIDPANYLISPINGDFTGLAPMEVFCGTKEIMYATFDTLIEKAKAAGVPVTAHVGEEMIHVWPYFLWSEESKHAMGEILRIIDI